MKRAVLFVLLLAGCGSDHKEDLVGSWDGKYEMSAAALEGAVQQARITSGSDAITADQIKAMVDSIGTSLTLNADDTYTLNMGPVIYTGLWAFDSDVVTLKIEKLNGMTRDEAIEKLKLNPLAAAQFNQPIKLNAAKDLKTLTGAAPDDPGSTMTFTKESVS